MYLECHCSVGDWPSCCQHLRCLSCLQTSGQMFSTPAQRSSASSSSNWCWYSTHTSATDVSRQMALSTLHALCPSVNRWRMFWDTWLRVRRVDFVEVSYVVIYFCLNFNFYEIDHYAKIWRLILGELFLWFDFEFLTLKFCFGQMIFNCCFWHFTWILLLSFDCWHFYCWSHHCC